MPWIAVQGLAELAAILTLAVAWGWGGGWLLDKALNRRRDTGANGRADPGAMNPEAPRRNN